MHLSLSSTSSPFKEAVKSLLLRSFRNYETLYFEVDSSLVIITGPNGAGKTNILEALSFLIPGRGFRRSTLQEICHKDNPHYPWAVSAKMISQGETFQIGTGLDPDALAQGNYRRLVNIQGITHKNHSILSEYVQALWLTPQMDRLFIDGSSERRNFIDRLVFNMDPSHSTRLNRYEHAVRERMRLLKEGCTHSSWLEGLEEQIATEGVAIETSRLRLIESLKHYLMRGGGVFPEASIDLQSSLSQWMENLPSLQVEEKFREELTRLRKEHTESGRMTTGIQRTDLITFFVDKNMPAPLCSTGEQKALLISLMLAAARYLSEYATGVPLLLLDEVIAHLDEKRRFALFQELSSLNIQTWLTGTDETLFAPLVPTTRLRIAEGKIIQD